MKYNSKFVVLETEANVYVGTLRDNRNGTVSVMSGLRGRPAIIDVEDVVSVTLAAESDLVEA